MKRTCNGCIALGLSFNMRDAVCCLNYKMTDDEKGIRPLEECPKPKTKKAHRECIVKKWEPK